MIITYNYNNHNSSHCYYIYIYILPPLAAPAMQFAHHGNFRWNEEIAYFENSLWESLGRPSFFWAAIRLLTPFSSRPSWTNCRLMLHGKSAALGQLGLSDLLAWLYRPGILMNVLPRAKRTSLWSSLCFQRTSKFDRSFGKKTTSTCLCHYHCCSLSILFTRCFYCFHLSLSRYGLVFQSSHPQLDEVGPCRRKTKKTTTSTSSSVTHLWSKLSRQYPFRKPGTVIIRQDLGHRNVRINESSCLTIMYHNHDIFLPYFFHISCCSKSFHVFLHQWSISHCQCCWPIGEWTWCIFGSLTRPTDMRWIWGSKVWTCSESIISETNYTNTNTDRFCRVSRCKWYKVQIPFIAGTLPKAWIQCIYCSTAGFFAMRNWGKTTGPTSLHRSPSGSPVIPWMGRQI